MGRLCLHPQFVSYYELFQFLFHNKAIDGPTMTSILKSTSMEAIIEAIAFILNRPRYAIPSGPDTISDKPMYFNSTITLSPGFRCGEVSTIVSTLHLQTPRYHQISIGHLYSAITGTRGQFSPQLVDIWRISRLKFFPDGSEFRTALQNSPLQAIIKKVNMYPYHLISSHYSRAMINSCAFGLAFGVGAQSNLIDTVEPNTTLDPEEDPNTFLGDSLATWLGTSEYTTTTSLLDILGPQVCLLHNIHSVADWFTSNLKIVHNIFFSAILAGDLATLDGIFGENAQPVRLGSFGHPAYQVALGTQNQENDPHIPFILMITLTLGWSPILIRQYAASFAYRDQIEMIRDEIDRISTQYHQKNNTIGHGLEHFLTESRYSDPMQSQRPNLDPGRIKPHSQQSFLWKQNPKQQYTQEQKQSSVFHTEQEKHDIIDQDAEKALNLELDPLLKEKYVLEEYTNRSRSIIIYFLGRFGIAVLSPLHCAVLWILAKVFIDDEMVTILTQIGINQDNYQAFSPEMRARRLKNIHHEFSFFPRPASCHDKLPGLATISQGLSDLNGFGAVVCPASYGQPIQQQQAYCELQDVPVPLIAPYTKQDMYNMLFCVAAHSNHDLFTVLFNQMVDNTNKRYPVIFANINQPKMGSTQDLLSQYKIPILQQSTSSIQHTSPSFQPQHLSFHPITGRYNFNPLLVLPEFNITFADVPFNWINSLVLSPLTTPILINTVLKLPKIITETFLSPRIVNIALTSGLTQLSAKNVGGVVQVWRDFCTSNKTLQSFSSQSTHLITTSRVAMTFGQILTGENALSLANDPQLVDSILQTYVKLLLNKNNLPFFEPSDYNNTANRLRFGKMVSVLKQTTYLVPRGEYLRANYRDIISDVYAKFIRHTLFPVSSILHSLPHDYGTSISQLLFQLSTAGEFTAMEEAIKGMKKALKKDGLLPSHFLDSIFNICPQVVDLRTFVEVPDIDAVLFGTNDDDDLYDACFDDSDGETIISAQQKPPASRQTTSRNTNLVNSIKQRSTPAPTTHTLPGLKTSCASRFSIFRANQLIRLSPHQNTPQSFYSFPQFYDYIPIEPLTKEEMDDLTQNYLIIQAERKKKMSKSSDSTTISTIQDDIPHFIPIFNINSPQAIADLPLPSFVLTIPPFFSDTSLMREFLSYPALNSQAFHPQSTLGMFYNLHLRKLLFEIPSSKSVVLSDDFVLAHHRAPTDKWASKISTEAIYLPKNPEWTYDGDTFPSSYTTLNFITYPNSANLSHQSTSSFVPININQPPNVRFNSNHLPHMYGVKYSPPTHFYATVPLNDGSSISNNLTPHVYSTRTAVRETTLPTKFRTSTPSQVTYTSSLYKFAFTERLFDTTLTRGMRYLDRLITMNDNIGEEQSTASKSHKFPLFSLLKTIRNIIGPSGLRASIELGYYTNIPTIALENGATPIVHQLLNVLYVTRHDLNPTSANLFQSQRAMQSNHMANIHRELHLRYLSAQTMLSLLGSTTLDVINPTKMVRKANGQLLKTRQYDAINNPTAINLNYSPKTGPCTPTGVLNRYFEWLSTREDVISYQQGRRQYLHACRNLCADPIYSLFHWDHLDQYGPLHSDALQWQVLCNILPPASDNDEPIVSDEDNFSDPGDDSNYEDEDENEDEDNDDIDSNLHFITSIYDEIDPKTLSSQNQTLLFAPPNIISDIRPDLDQQQTTLQDLVDTTTGNIPLITSDSETVNNFQMLSTPTWFCWDFIQFINSPTTTSLNKPHHKANKACFGRGLRAFEICTTMNRENWLEIPSSTIVIDLSHQQFSLLNSLLYSVAHDVVNDYNKTHQVDRVRYTHLKQTQEYLSSTGALDLLLHPHNLPRNEFQSHYHHLQLNSTLLLAQHIHSIPTEWSLKTHNQKPQPWATLAQSIKHTRYLSPALVYQYMTVPSQEPGALASLNDLFLFQCHGRTHPQKVACYRYNTGDVQPRITFDLIEFTYGLYYDPIPILLLMKEQQEKMFDVASCQSLASLNDISPKELMLELVQRSIAIWALAAPIPLKVHGQHWAVSSKRNLYDLKWEALLENIFVGLAPLSLAALLWIIHLESSGKRIKLMRQYQDGLIQAQVQSHSDAMLKGGRAGDRGRGKSVPRRNSSNSPPNRSTLHL